MQGMEGAWEEASMRAGDEGDARAMGDLAEGQRARCTVLYLKAPVLRSAFTSAARCLGILSCRCSAPMNSSSLQLAAGPVHLAYHPRLIAS